MQTPCRLQQPCDILLFPSRAQSFSDGTMITLTNAETGENVTVDGDRVILTGGEATPFRVINSGEVFKNEEGGLALEANGLSVRHCNYTCWAHPVRPAVVPRYACLLYRLTVWAIRQSTPTPLLPRTLRLYRELSLRVATTTSPGALSSRTTAPGSSTTGVLPRIRQAIGTGRNASVYQLLRPLLGTPTTVRSTTLTSLRGAHKSPAATAGGS